MQRSGMLVISLVGMNQGFWSHLEVHDETPLSIFKGALDKIITTNRLYKARSQPAAGDRAHSVLSSIFLE